MSTSIKLTWGDCSKDGHGMTETVMIEAISLDGGIRTPAQMKDVVKAASVLAADFCSKHNILRGYEDTVISEAGWAAIEAEGIAFPPDWDEHFDRECAFSDDEATDLLLAMINHFAEGAIKVSRPESDFPSLDVYFGYGCFSL
jgi:hypothetical protein